MSLSYIIHVLIGCYGCKYDHYAPLKHEGGPVYKIKFPIRMLVPCCTVLKWHATTKLYMYFGFPDMMTKLKVVIDSRKFYFQMNRLGVFTFFILKLKEQMGSVHPLHM